jgi:hypothetical protein
MVSDLLETLVVGLLAEYAFEARYGYRVLRLRSGWHGEFHEEEARLLHQAVYVGERDSAFESRVGSGGFEFFGDSVQQAESCSHGG